MSTKTQLSNCSKNLNYLIRCINPSFSQKTYIPGETFTDMNISLSTLKNVLAGKNASDRTLRIIANSFSNYLKDSENQLISDKDLVLDPADFKEKFPELGFLAVRHPGSWQLELYTNKLYRCYYMISSSPYNAFMAYFKLFQNGNELIACMVKGIQDFQHAADILPNFDSPKNLIECMRNKKNQANGSKMHESINLYIADSGSIKTSPDCIQINFKSMEDDPCYSSMFWNISTTSRMTNIETYIGGTALMVDTNEGIRGKDICSYKIGLEAVENDKNRETSKSLPISKTSPNLINELSNEAKHGVYTVDNGDDARWFRFLQQDRTESSKMYTADDLKGFAFDLLKLKHDYTVEIERLRKCLDEFEKK